MEKNRHILSKYLRLIRLGITLLWAVIGIALLPGIQPCFAVENRSEPLLTSVLTRIKDREQGLKTFTASFIQTQQNELLTAPLVSKGMLFYDQSGKILLKMTDPESFVVLITDGRITMGDPATKSFKHKKLPGRESFLKRYVGSGDSLAGLKASYDIRLNGECSSSDCRLDFSPKKKSRRMPFQQIQVTVDPKRWLPTVIDLKESNGNFTRFELFYRTINTPLPPDTFNPDWLKGEK